MNRHLPVVVILAALGLAACGSGEDGEVRSAAPGIQAAAANTDTGAGVGAGAGTAAGPSDAGAGKGDFGRFCAAVNAITEVKDQALDAALARNPKVSRSEAYRERASRLAGHQREFDALIRYATPPYVDIARTYAAAYRAWSPSSPDDTAMFNTPEFRSAERGFYKAWNNDCA